MQVIDYQGKDMYTCLAIDLFAFSYFSAGINFVDMAHLKQSNMLTQTDLYTPKDQQTNPPAVTAKGPRNHRQVHHPVPQRPKLYFPYPVLIPQNRGSATQPLT